MKKMMAYQRLLNRNVASGTGYLVIVLLGFVTGVVDTFARRFFTYDIGLLTWLFLALCCVGAVMTGNANLKMIRTLPVSDAFAVAGSMFGIPVFFGSVVIPVLLLALLIWAGVAEGGFGWISDAREVNLMGNLFALMIAAGVWFWVCIGAFHRDSKRRRIWYALEFAICLAALVILSFVLRTMGIVVEFSLSDLVWVFDPVAVMLAGAFFAAASGVIAWKWNLKLYKADVKGQAEAGDDRSQVEEQYIADVDRMLSKKGRRGRAVLLLVAVLVYAGGILGVLGLLGYFDESEKVDIVTSDPFQYTDWSVYGKKMGLEEDEWKTGGIVFPEDIDTACIEEYYVHINGSYGKGDEVSWTSISTLRYMVAVFPEEEYRKEKERIAELSVTCEDEDIDGGTNRVLHDTEHFAAEAYIAVYQEGYAYEYALTDDQACQIIYLLSEDMELGEVPTQKEFRANAFTKVIPLTQANTEMKGYSVYSFRDARFGVWTE